MNVNQIETEQFKISVIVPVYNIKSYLDRCINSIINQTYRNLQIILIDDGSTDGSELICDRFAAIDHRIIVIHKENAGLVSARKKGLEIAWGDYIGFVDGDDYIEKEMYSELLDRILESKADFVHSGYIEERENKVNSYLDFEDMTIDLSQNRLKYVSDYVLLPNNGNFMAFSLWSKLFKAELIKDSYKKVPDFLQYGEDLYSLCICLMNGNRVSMKRDAYYHYVIRGNSLSKKRDVSLFLKECDLYRELCKLFNECCVFFQLKNVLELYFQNSMIYCIEYLTNIKLHKYHFKKLHILKGKEIVIYGAGNVGKDYYNQINEEQCCKVVALVDKNNDKKINDLIKVESVETILNIKFDILVIAVNNEIIADEIRNELNKYGIDKKKIIWEKPNYVLID